MGYMIIRRTFRGGSSSYVTWMPDSYRIANEMREWLCEGRTLEILEHVTTTPDTGGHERVAAVIRWERHFRYPQESELCSSD